MSQISVSDNLYVITNKQVMKEWGDDSTTVDRGPMKFLKTREQIYMGVIEDSTSHGFRLYDDLERYLVHHATCNSKFKFHYNM